MPSTLSRAAEPIGRVRPSHFKLSLAAYSYRDYLAGPKTSMDLFDFVNLAADLGLDGVEPTAYYFPKEVPNDYLRRLKQQAFLSGLDISGTAIMNDFCLPPGKEADQEMEHVRSWIDRAAELTAPVVRLLSGNWLQGTPDEELEQRVIDLNAGAESTENFTIPFTRGGEQRVLVERLQGDGKIQVGDVLRGRREGMRRRDPPYPRDRAPRLL
jgi:hypothetical protein